MTTTTTRGIKTRLFLRLALATKRSALSHIVASAVRGRRRRRRQRRAVTSVFTRDDAPPLRARRGERGQRGRRRGRREVSCRQKCYIRRYSTGDRRVAAVKRYHARHNCSRYAFPLSPSPSPSPSSPHRTADDAAADSRVWAAARRV